MEKRLPLPIGTILQNRYRIDRQLGHGGFGAVYEAVDDDLNLSFALKETFYAADEELRHAFKREARMLASLSHEAFPRVTHFFTGDDGCFLVMELIYGDDLDKLLAKRGAPFEEKQVLEWADQILDALEDLHAKNIIHRDIKPSNLKLTDKGKIKLLDFGIAKGAVEGETTILTTIGSLAAATLQYAPLEQVLKAAPQYQMMLSVVSSDKVSKIMQYRTDAASDLYSLAATLYHLFTGQLPADAPTRTLAAWSGQQDRLIAAHKINPHIKREVSEILQKAMSLDRVNRYKSATEMRRAFKEAVRLPKQIKPAPKMDKSYEVKTRIRPRPSSDSNMRNHYGSRFSLFKWAGEYQSELKQIIVGLPFIWLVLFPVGSVAYFTFKFTLGKNVNYAASTAGSQYKLTNTLTGHNNGTRSVAFSPDGKTIVSGSSDKAIMIWRME